MERREKNRIEKKRRGRRMERRKESRKWEGEGRRAEKRRQAVQFPYWTQIAKFSHLRPHPIRFSFLFFNYSFSISFSLPFSFYMSLSLFLSLSVCLSVSLSLSLSLSLPLGAMLGTGLGIATVAMIGDSYVHTFAAFSTFTVLSLGAQYFFPHLIRPFFWFFRALPCLTLLSLFF